jgi:hypothetical protein
MMLHVEHQTAPAATLPHASAGTLNLFIFADHQRLAALDDIGDGPEGSSRSARRTSLLPAEFLQLHALEIAARETVRLWPSKRV